MSKTTEKVIVALLVLSTAANVVTAVELIRLARNGFDVEITESEAAELIEAAEVAEEDMAE